MFNIDGTFIKTWGKKGNKNGEFETPHGIAIKDEIVYIADTNNNRVQMLTLDGNFLKTVGNVYDFYLPYSIAIHKTKNILIVVGPHNCIKLYQD